MITSRRAFLTGLVAAPAVLRLGLYMPVRKWIEPRPLRFFVAQDVSSWARMMLAHNIGDAITMNGPPYRGRLHNAL